MAGEIWPALCNVLLRNVPPPVGTELPTLSLDCVDTEDGDEGTAGRAERPAMLRPVCRLGPSPGFREHFGRPDVHECQESGRGLVVLQVGATYQVHLEVFPLELVVENAERERDGEVGVHNNLETVFPVAKSLSVYTEGMGESVVFFCVDHCKGSTEKLAQGGAGAGAGRSLQLDPSHWTGLWYRPEENSRTVRHLRLDEAILAEDLGVGSAGDNSDSSTDSSDDSSGSDEPELVFKEDDIDFPEVGSSYSWPFFLTRTSTEHPLPGGVGVFCDQEGQFLTVMHSNEQKKLCEIYRVPCRNAADMDMEFLSVHIDEDRDRGIAVFVRMLSAAFGNTTDMTVFWWESGFRGAVDISVESDQVRSSTCYGDDGNVRVAIATAGILKIIEVVGNEATCHNVALTGGSRVPELTWCPSGRLLLVHNLLVDIANALAPRVLACLPNLDRPGNPHQGVRFFLDNSAVIVEREVFLLPRTAAVKSAYKT
jgi:hypothetical protein